MLDNSMPTAILSVYEENYLFPYNSGSFRVLGPSHAIIINLIPKTHHLQSLKLT